MHKDEGMKTPLNLTSFPDKDPIINGLNKVVLCCIYFLAILSVLVILWSLLDVVYDLYEQAVHSPSILFSQEKMIGALGNFLVVMIAIEIYLSIIFFLREYSIHVPLVLATALTAVARKVIILEYAQTTPLMNIAIATVIFSVGVVYWLVSKNSVKPGLNQVKSL